MMMPADSETQSDPIYDQKTGHWKSTIGSVLVVLICIWIVHPVLEAGFSDDYSYIYSAKRAAETGRLIYNGWATTSLGIQVYLGALFIHLFGFSFTVTRSVCWVLSLANVALLHRLFLRVAQNNFNAVLAALTIGLAPITFSMSLVFFTDLPAMFAFTVVLYCCVRAMQAEAGVSIKRWLIVAVLLGLVLGSVRQIAWGAALAMVPMVGWHLRSRSGVLRLTLLLEAFTICVVVVALLWLKQAPYMVHEALYLPASKAKLLLLPFLPVVLLLELLPLLVGLVELPALRSRRTLLLAVVVAATFVPWIAFKRNIAPSMLVDTYLQFPLAYTRLFGGVLIVVAVFLATFAVRVAVPAFRRDQHVTPESISFRDLFFITAPYFLISMVLIETRLGVWSRYVIGLEPAAAVWLLALHAEHSCRGRFKMPAVITAGICCSFGVVLARDNFRILVPTLKLEQWAQANSLPRDQLEAGMESDGWFEISHGHTIHDPRILLPIGASVQRSVAPGMRACHQMWISMFADIHPVYTISPRFSPCYDPVPLHAEMQRFWIRPPITQYLYRYVPSQQIR